MTWMKVDDGLYDHPKMFDAPDCAVALWTRAGSWAARNLTDGFVPEGMARRLCDDPERAVKELVTRGLWEEAEGGFRFHDWLSYNRSKEQVLEDRRRDAAKKAAARAELARKRRKTRSTRPGGTPSGTPPVNPAESPGLPDPGSLPSSGNPAAAAGGGAPAAVPAVHVPTSSPEVRAAARRDAGLKPPARRSRHAAPSDRPLVASVARSAPGDPARAEQDRLAELDAVQAADPTPAERVPPSPGVYGPPADLQEQETA